MLPDQFWQLTYRELSYMAAGHQRRLLDHVRPLREVYAAIKNSQFEPKDWKPTAAWWPLPGDEQPAAPAPMSEEETLSMIERIRARDAKNAAHG